MPKIRENERYNKNAETHSRKGNAVTQRLSAMFKVVTEKDNRWSVNKTTPYT